MGFRIAKGPFEMGLWNDLPMGSAKLGPLGGYRSIEEAQAVLLYLRIRRSSSFAHEPVDQRRWGSQYLALVIGQGFLASFDPALPLVKENGQATRQGEIPCRGRMADRAPIFILGAISPGNAGHLHIHLALVISA